MLGLSLFSCLFIRAPVSRIYYHFPTGDNSRVLRSSIWIRGVVVIPVTNERRIPRRIIRAGLERLVILSGISETRYENGREAYLRWEKFSKLCDISECFFDRAKTANKLAHPLLVCINRSAFFLSRLCIACHSSICSVLHSA